MFRITVIIRYGWPPSQMYSSPLRPRSGSLAGPTSCRPGYKRPGPDGRIRWAPPSALRRVDLLLADEGSQYADSEWRRLYQSIKEQPHGLFTVVFADFQQLQPLGEGYLCWQQCQRMEQVLLQTVYRSKDEEHLLFLNRIRERQPTRADLQEYFGDRQWHHYSLRECVAYGMEIGRQRGRQFFWFTHTNAGASRVCREAVACEGISDEDLENGYLCDPESKSDLRVVARPGILVRLTRNFDKQRGFVNGAVGVVWESLCGNGVFVVKLLGTGNLVLVHPMEEDGQRFLPCCYGYAMTVRRAQGLGVDLGCIFFDQRKRAAGRSTIAVAADVSSSAAGEAGINMRVPLIIVVMRHIYIYI